MKRFTVVSCTDGLCLLRESGALEEIEAVDPLGCEQGQRVYAIGGAIGQRLFPEAARSWVIAGVEK